MKKILLVATIAISIMACNNESDSAGLKDSTEMKGNGDSVSGGTITAPIDSSTSIRQSDGTLNDSVGAMKTDTSEKD